MAAAAFVGNEMIAGRQSDHGRKRHISSGKVRNPLRFEQVLDPKWFGGLESDVGRGKCSDLPGERDQHQAHPASRADSSSGGDHNTAFTTGNANGPSLSGLLLHRRFDAAEKLLPSAVPDLSNPAVDAMPDKRRRRVNLIPQLVLGEELVPGRIRAENKRHTIFAAGVDSIPGEYRRCVEGASRRSFHFSSPVRASQQ